MIDTGVAIRTSEQVVAEVGKLKSHVVTPIVIAKSDFSSTTLTEIRKYFKFTAHKENNWIYAFTDSTQTVHEKRYQPKDILAMSDIELNRIKSKNQQNHVFLLKFHQLACQTSNLLSFLKSTL